MKKFVLAALTAGVIMVSGQAAFADSNTVKVKLDSADVVFSGQQPVIVNGRTLIPLRGVFEKMGYDIAWDGQTKTATLTAEGTTVKVAANATAFDVNGKSTALDVPAQIMNGSMMLPLRAIGEAAGANVSWDGASKTVSINTSAADVNSLVAASDYLVAYSKATSQLDDVKKLWKELESLNGEITATELQNYRVKLYNAGESVKSVKAAVERLTPPDNLKELHQVRLSSLDKLSEMIDVLIDYCDGNISEEKAMDKISEISVDSDELTRKSNELLEQITIK